MSLSQLVVVADTVLRSRDSRVEGTLGQTMQEFGGLRDTWFARMPSSVEPGIAVKAPTKTYHEECMEAIQRLVNELDDDGVNAAGPMIDMNKFKDAEEGHVGEVSLIEKQRTVSSRAARRSGTPLEENTDFTWVLLEKDMKTDGSTKLLGQHVRETYRLAEAGLTASLGLVNWWVLNEEQGAFNVVGVDGGELASAV